MSVYATTFCSACKSETVHEAYQDGSPYFCMRHEQAELKMWESMITSMQKVAAGLTWAELIEIQKRVFIPRMDYLADRIENKLTKDWFLEFMAAQWPKSA